MKQLIAFICVVLTPSLVFSQAGHIMQGTGSVNMSMGGAATAQPIDITGALQWNPATIASFDGTIAKLDVGLFFSSPELGSTVPMMDNFGQPTGQFMTGTTKDDRGISPMPSLAIVWADKDSPHTFGASAIGISGFGVTFPENMSNPINMPQEMGGFGRIESDYMLLQVGFTYAYQITEKLSVGLEPTFNFATLELLPNPTSNPTQAGYPGAERASATGFGGQIGLFYDTGSGLKLGASYKTTQHFSNFQFDNTFLDNSSGENEFNMDYPAIYSLGLGYSLDLLDVAVDYRLVDYENTDGFSETGWTSSASVAGFGWKNISIISAGVQFKGITAIPIRAGYTYSSNPIDSEVAFFNVPATAVLNNAYQFGFSYVPGDKLSVDVMYHHGMSNGSTTGSLLNPQFSSPESPFGAIPGSEVSYDMTTDLIMIGVTYNFK